MKLIELKTVEPIAKAKYLRMLQNRGRLTKYVNEKGFVCYDEKELAEYKANAIIGRPKSNRKVINRRANIGRPPKDAVFITEQD